MESSSCAFLYLVTVLGDDVNKCLSNHSISSYKEVDVLAALAVEEFVMDGLDGCICI